jgi:hypothetical protein
VTDLIARIDETITGLALCPCGADLPPGQPYCSDDCTPTHLGDGQDQWSPYASTDRWAHLGRTLAESTDPQSRPVCEWLQSNGINPGDVLEDAPITVGGDTITVMSPQRDPDGSVLLDPGDRRIVLTEQRVHPLINPRR